MKRSAKLDSPERAATIFETSVGRLGALSIDGQLVSTTLNPDGHLTISADGVLAAFETQVHEYLKGERQIFDLPYATDGWSDFQRDVLETLRCVEYGELVTYGELAARSGHPRSARAVGGAMRSNPLPIIIPCHRVIAADGSLGGFLGGPTLKRRLVEIEGTIAPKGGWTLACGSIAKDVVLQA